MHSYGFDAPSACVAGLLSGQYSDADIEDLIRVSFLLDKEGERQNKLTAHLLFVEEGYARPNASMRRQLAEALGKFKVKKPLFALITKSMMIRGILTTVRWIAPTVHDSNVFATFEEGALWLEQKRNEKLPALFKLWEDARTKSMIKIVR